MIKNKKTYLVYIIAVLFLTLSCSNSNAASNSDCSMRLPAADSSMALSRISFKVPSNWKEVEAKQTYTTGESLLTVLIYETNATSKLCIETLLQGLSSQSLVINYKINSTDFYIDKQPATIATANGYSDNSKSVPFYGIYAGVDSDKWVYIFAWNSFGSNAIEAIADDSLYTIGTIQFK